MVKIITTENPTEEELNLLLQEYLQQFPVHLQKQAEDAMRAYFQEDYQRAGALCDELLAKTDVLDIRDMRGQCYFSEQDWENALEIYERLATEYPDHPEYDIRYGMVFHAIGDFERAVEILEKHYPLEKYIPFFYTSFGDALMMLGKMEPAREVFAKETEYFELTGKLFSALMVDGAYQNLFILDLETGNGLFQKDMESYWKFLEAAAMDSEMQAHLADTIYLLSNYLTIQDFQPLFKRFIEHIRDGRYLTEQPYLLTLESGFSALEIQRIHDDRNINAMLEAFMAFSIQAQRAEQAGTLSENPKLQVRLAVYEWYLCRYAPEHPDELEYIRKAFPYNYRTVEGFLAEIGRDVQDAADKRLKFLAPYYSGKDMDEIRASMEEAYQKALRDQKEPSYVYDGTETYKRIQPKVGRNDPCPCGSGKKYKKCCGR